MSWVVSSRRAFRQFEMVDHESLLSKLSNGVLFFLFLFLCKGESDVPFGSLALLLLSQSSLSLGS